MVPKCGSTPADARRSVRIRWRSAVALGTAILLAAACGGSSGTVSPQALEDSLVFYGPAGSLQDGVQKCTTDGFQRKYNITVTVLAAAAPDSLAKVTAQKNNPTVDVIWAADPEQVRGGQQGVFAELPLSAVPNLAEVNPDYKPKDKFGAPVAVGIAGLEYNTKIFKDKGWGPPTSWNDLWDPKFKGHVGILTISQAPTQAVFTVILNQTGGSIRNPDAAFKKFSELRPNLYAVYSGGSQVEQGFQQGVLWIAEQATSRVLPAMAAGQPVDMVQPKEGAAPFFLYLDIIKGAPHPKAAAAYVNYMLSPESQNCFPGSLGYGGVRKDSKVSSDKAKYFAGGGPPVIKVDYPAIQAQLPDWLARWNKEVEGK